MIRRFKQANWLVCAGLVAVAIAAGLAWLTFDGIEDPAGRIAALTAIAGGVGSGYGGVAAAISAGRSRDAAERSDEIARTVAQIGADSRAALARALKPELEILLHADANSTTLNILSVGNTEARDIDIELSLPGSSEPIYNHSPTLPPRQESPLGINVPMPAIQGPIEEVSERTRERGPRSLIFEVALRFSDKDRIARYENTYRIISAVQIDNGAWHSSEPMMWRIGSKEIHA